MGTYPISQQASTLQANAGGNLKPKWHPCTNAVPQADGPNNRLTTYCQPLTEMAEDLVKVLNSNEVNELDRLFMGRFFARGSAQSASKLIVFN